MVQIRKAYKQKMTRRKYRMECEAGYYTANSFWGLGWAIFKHRLWHLAHGHGWVD